jgi:predicted dehydrogenase
MESGNRKVKLGFVGCGFMGQLAHLANYADNSKCELLAVAELRDELREKVADKYGIPRRYRSHAELAADPEVEAVVAILPHVQNASVAVPLLEAGKHVLVEKPMAGSAANAERMARAAAENGVHLMVAFMKRYDPGVEIARDIIAEAQLTGELGAITFVRAHVFGGDWICNLGRPITTGEAHPPVEGGGPDWMIPERQGLFQNYNNIVAHNMNLVRYLLDFKGEPEARHADFGTRTKMTLLGFDGVMCSLEWGGIASHKWDEETKVYFERGWVDVKTPPPLLKNVPAQVEVYRMGDTKEISYPIAAWEWAFKRQADHFVECVLTGHEPRSSGSDSVMDMRASESVFRLLGYGSPGKV